MKTKSPKPKAITVKEKWQHPVPVREHSREVWWYRDGRGIDVVAYPPPQSSGPAHFRIPAGQLRKYLKELDSLTLPKGRKP